MSIKLIGVFVNLTENQHVSNKKIQEMPFYRHNDSKRVMPGCS